MTILLFVQLSLMFSSRDSLLGLEHGKHAVTVHACTFKVPGKVTQGFAQTLKKRTIDAMIWRSGHTGKQSHLLDIFREIDPRFSRDAFVDRWVRRGANERTLLDTLESLVVFSPKERQSQDIDPSKDTLIYYPGFGGYPFENAALFEYLASHGYQVIALSQQGFYDFPSYPNATDLSASVEDVLFILSKFDPENLPRIFTMGHSWGGLVSQLAAVKSPLIEGCIVLDGSQTASDYNDMAFEVVSEQRLKRFDKPLMAFLSAGYHHDLSFYSGKIFGVTVLAKGFRVGHPHFTMNGVLFLEWAQAHSFRESDLVKHPFVKAYRDQCLAIHHFLKSPSSPVFDDIERSEYYFSIKKGEERIPSQAEFEFLLQDPQNIAQCVEIFHRSQLVDPNLILFGEDLALSVGQSFLRSEFKFAAKMVFGMVVHAYPSSAEANYWQGFYFEQMELDQAAIRYYRQAVYLNPNHNRYKQALTNLEN